MSNKDKINPTNKKKKISLLDGSSSVFLQNEVLDTIKDTKTKKSTHLRNHSNAEEFAFSEATENFVKTNFEDLISTIKNGKKKEGKSESDGKLDKKNIYSENNDNKVQPSKTFNKLPDTDLDFITQVDKVDIQNLTNIEKIKDFYDYTENCLLLIGKLPMPDYKIIEPMQVDLPDKLLKKKLAIFDLDETLIHCELKNPQAADKIITIKLPNGSKTRVGLNIRPGIIPALDQIMKSYNLIIFTASDQHYADSVINYIDPTKHYFKYRLFRHNCVKLQTENGTIYVKDLRIIRNVPLSNMVIIDNSVLSFAFHLENGIPILPYYNNKKDVEMESLCNYLTKLAKYENLTITNGANFNLKALQVEAQQSQDDEDNDETLNDNIKEEKKLPNEQNLNSENPNSSNKNCSNTLEVKLTYPARKKSKLLQHKIHDKFEAAKIGI